MNNFLSSGDRGLEEKRQKSRILLEIDSIFDMRLATLAVMGKDKVMSALKGNYFERASDVFNGVDYDEFKTAYAKRDKSYLRFASQTPVIKLAHDFALTTLENVNNSPFHFDPVIMINIYPYVLSEPEIEIIVKSLAQVTNGIADIEAVNMRYEEITPLYLKLNLSMMVIYEFDKWLETHSVTGAWLKHTAPDVSVLAPRISMIKTGRDFTADNAAFDTLIETVRPFVDLKLLRSDVFSCSLRQEHFELAKKNF